jgi:hypothetical protein
VLASPDSDQVGGSSSNDNALCSPQAPGPTLQRLDVRLLTPSGGFSFLSPCTLCNFIDATSEGPIRRTRERGSEWEPIKILLEGDGDSNKMNTASNTRLRLTTQVGQAHVATGVPLDLETNELPSEPKHTNMHSGNLHSLLPVLHRSDRWPAPVRPVTPIRQMDRAGQAGGYSSHTTSVPESLSDFSRPLNKNTPKPEPARKENPTQNNSKQTKN